jgi:hypothetical protein
MVNGRLPNDGGEKAGRAGSCLEFGTISRAPLRSRSPQLQRIA